MGTVAHIYGSKGDPWIWVNIDTKPMKTDLRTLKIARPC